jgi:hypothetical protein
MVHRGLDQLQGIIAHAKDLSLSMSRRSNMLLVS